MHPRTKKKIAERSLEIIRAEPEKEIFSRNLIFKLSHNGLKGTVIHTTALTYILRKYAPEIIRESRAVNNGLRQTTVVVYKLKE